MISIIIMITKTITIHEYQGEWITKNHINLSRLVQDTIKNEMERSEK